MSGYGQMAATYEEISVTLNVQRVGSTEISALIKNELTWLPVKEIFDFLKIKNNLSAAEDSITGYFISPKASFIIDKINSRITFVDKIFDLSVADLVNTPGSLYLRSDYFGKIFDLTCNFNFRSLSVNLVSNIELPAVRELQQEQMHRNITKLKGERVADTTIKQSFSFFHLGMADWSIISTDVTTGATNTRLTINAGGIVLGGEANVYINHNSHAPLEPGQQFYRWKFVNNSNAALRQVTLGNVFVQPTASVYGAIRGVQFSNTPTTYRRSFGTYRLTNTTEPGWTVELYVNNVLVNYTKADASGFFAFDVPLVYGNSAIKLRYFGPWGEEKTSEQNIGIPFNFLPDKQFEYNLSAGIIDDDEKNKFSRLAMNYGLVSRITIGGGVEYHSGVTSGRTMPFLNASVRLGSNLLITGEHTYHVRSKAILSYRLPSNVQAEFNYIKYDKGQTAIRAGIKSNNNYLEEKKAIISIPFASKKFRVFSRFSFNQLKLTNAKYTTAEFLISGVFHGISSNLTTSAIYSNPKHPFMYSNLSATFRLPKGVRLTPQAQYEHIQKNFSMLKCEVEKNLFNRGFLNISYEKNIVTDLRYVNVGIRYNLSFAQTAFSITNSSAVTTTVKSVRGSLLYDDNINKLRVSNQSNTGRGGITIFSFLDLNNNGLRDAGEPKVAGLKLHINGGRLFNNKDTSISITGLEAYTNYFVELDKGSFDNVAWQIAKRTMNITVEPNHFKLIQVPVAVMGEVSGMVYLKKNNNETGIGRIIVNIYNSQLAVVATVLSEADGYFTYFGLRPGDYTIHFDEKQLAKLNMTASPAISFNIKGGKEGDVVDGLKLAIQSLEK